MRYNIKTVIDGLLNTVTLKRFGKIEIVNNKLVVTKVKAKQN